MSNPGISLTTLDPQYQQIQRQQRLAELLQQQSQEPDQIYSSNGTPAPIAGISPFVKALQGYMGASMQKKSLDKLQDLQTTQRQQAADALQKMYAPPQTLQSGDASFPAQQINVQAPHVPGGGPALPNATAQMPAMQAPGQQMQTAPQGPSSADILQMMMSSNPYVQQVAPGMMQHQMARDDKVWENQLPQSQASRDAMAQQGQITLQNAEDEAKFRNGLPLDAAGRQAHADRMAELNKPQFVPYGAPGYMQGGKYVPLPAGAGGAVTADQSSPSAPVQLGLSSGAYSLLTGATGNLGTRDKAAANKELDAFFARSGLDPSLVKPQVQAYGSAVNMNTLKANTMDTLAKEVVGTVANYGPVIDKLTGGGNLRLGNKGWELLGSAVNDPTAQQAIVYLNQMRADLAGFNAASGGKIGMHGQTATDNADFAKADEVIKSGLSSGGAKAIAEAIEATRQKNVAVAQQQVQEAQRGIWNALGIGSRFDATHPGQKPQPVNNGGAPPPVTKVIGGKTYHFNNGKWYEGGN